MNTGRSGKCGNTGRECGKVQLKASKELVISKLFEHEIRTLERLKKLSRITASGKGTTRGKKQKTKKLPSP